MQERYSERAKWLIHKAYEEARRLGSPQLCAEHLLMGVLHEEKSFFYAEAAEALAAALEEAVPKGPPLDSDTLIPLNEEAKHILAEAGIAASQFGQEEITVAHILWLLTKHRDTRTGVLLAAAGVRTEQVEEAIRGSV